MDAKLSRQEMERIVEDMRSLMRRDVEIGLDSHDEILRMTTEGLADSYECDEEYDCSADDLMPLAQETLAEIVRKCRREQESWPRITDCDRLEAAFTDLNWSGIVCRQNFMDCSNCGHKEIWNEIEAERKLEREVRGYAFYHAQSTDTAVEGEGLWLNHGSVDDEDADLRIAQETVESLRNHGLDVSWPGQASKTIEVRMDWKHRVSPDGTLLLGTYR